ncbi:MAG: toprim domain-containing protein [Deferrisomatales bacterium]|nr:toprim domain-containing protein [Deferrisomatales bacterium]
MTGDVSRSGIDLEALKRRVDLVALGERHGVRWVPGSGLPRARCPFHEEDTPSFVAYQEPQVGAPRFECFGTCARTWDAIAFVREKIGLGFAETVRELATAAGVDVSAAHVDPTQLRAEKDRREEILRALEAAQEYFAKALHADLPTAARARAYLDERELEEAVGPWGIGYAPGTGGLTRWLQGRGFAEDLLLDAYLLRPGKEGRPAYEFQRNRLTFPMRDRRGRIVAHVGRSVPDEDGRAADPKYLNPGKVPGVYAKRETLFGFFEARESIRKAGFAWIVEGPLDAVRLHLAGLPHAVALGGTAFSEAQAKLLLAAGAREVIFLLDADDAGEKALTRALPVCLTAGLQARVVMLPDGEDPDSLLRWRPPSAGRPTGATVSADGTR